jgi:hypothetical protein
MWSVRELGYTYETDIMSAYTFLNVCHWYNIKPNPAIDIGLPSPPLPVLPPETRGFGPVPAVSPDIADGADTVIPPPGATREEEKEEEKEKQQGTIAGIMEEQAAAKPNLRGHTGKGKGKEKGKETEKPTEKAKGGNKPSIASTRASAFFPQPQQQPLEATKEWATAQAAVAPFEPHGKGLIVEENRIFVTCMARVARGEEPGWTREDCMRAVLRRDCELLGYICDLPEKYKEGMFAEEAEEVFKRGNVCARACEAPEHRGFEG